MLLSPSLAEDALVEERRGGGKAAVELLSEREARLDCLDDELRVECLIADRDEVQQTEAKVVPDVLESRIGGFGPLAVVYNRLKQNLQLVLGFVAAKELEESGHEVNLWQLRAIG